MFHTPGSLPLPVVPATIPHPVFCLLLWSETRYICGAILHINPLAIAEE